ncbi:DUF4232 domain-containing protein [Actinacidiphila acididurans]|uniref:DUF4232 domain-containing protein n=1 Tax=Actinacidiphila acididurans TaxID=2784346 RepID=A0ABS2U248_9ACTN|nr:DUF4232 domain-containing protein [Actinacidiphila acididurans]MBM9509668.1 DUF4232 domain-containing protein [Actinacidiphila acididurans]
MSTNSGSTGSTPTAAPTADGVSDNSASSGGASGSSGSSGSSDTSQVSSTGSGASAGSGRCHTADLSFAVAPGSGAQSVGSAGGVIIKMTNNGAGTCTMKGYPGVDLVGGGRTWSLSRQTSVTPHAVTVAQGHSTSFTITYLPFAAGDGQELDVKTVVITPPNDTTSAKVAWDFQPVLLQDGATHPGTYVGPVGAE